MHCLVILYIGESKEVVTYFKADLNPGRINLGYWIAKMIFGSNTLVPKSNSVADRAWHVQRTWLKLCSHWTFSSVVIDHAESYRDWLWCNSNLDLYSATKRFIRCYRLSECHTSRALCTVTFDLCGIWRSCDVVFSRSEFVGHLNKPDPLTRRALLLAHTLLHITQRSLYYKHWLNILHHFSCAFISIFTFI